MSKIKICGLFRACDIVYVNDAKPDYAGFIMDFPKSHRSVNFETASALIARLDKDIKSVCVLVNQSIEYALKFKNICNIIQLHGNEDNDYIAQLKEEMPQTEIWKAFKIRSQVDVEKARNSLADMVILDNGYGTGEVFDWKIISDFDREFILAGGINLGNVAEAIDKFNPYALDLSSSVESEKIKDFNKIKQMIEAVRSMEND